MCFTDTVCSTLLIVIYHFVTKIETINLVVSCFQQIVHKFPRNMIQPEFFLEKYACLIVAIWFDWLYRHKQIGVLHKLYFWLGPLEPLPGTYRPVMRILPWTWELGKIFYVLLTKRGIYHYIYFMKYNIVECCMGKIFCVAFQVLLPIYWKMCIS